MKIKVLLLNLPWQRNSSWGVRAGSRWPHIRDINEGEYLPFPFFLAYAASLLQKNNINSFIIDAIADKVEENKLFEKIKSINPEHIIIETSVPSFHNDLRITKIISEMGFSIILCGPNFEIYKPEFLKKHEFINYVLYGEYECSLLELLNFLEKGKNLSNVKGLIYRDRESVVKNLKREPFDINILPWPHRETLPMNKYLDAPGEMLTPCAQIIASRGCPFKCQFCLWPQVVYQGNHYRAREIKDVVDEMEYLVKEKGFKSVYFDDDTFNIGKKRMLDFCGEIKNRGLNKIQWAIMARPDLMDEEILTAMKESGLWAIKYGVESSDQGLVDNIEKGMNLQKAKKMIQFTKMLGIKTHLTFTFGIPGETKQTIQKTIDFVRKIDPFSVQFSIMTPFPGTKSYDIFDEKGLFVIKDFSAYDGHFKSVISTVNLTATDLENAKIKAGRIWLDHLRKRRGFFGNLRRFQEYMSMYSLSSAFRKTLSYLKYVVIERKKYVDTEDI
ncbi:MAG: radical SAM protein [Candidatus Omnitrophica bacterium]|nr:radical SAM protein [Candidatus Omnitrophota bacterium]MCK5287439.1 radical SAM protein [Candidatus Omnitrophota bacterium]